MQVENMVPRSSLYYFLGERLIGNAVRGPRETEEINRRSRKRRYNNILEISNKEFKKRFRLTKEAFHFLCEKLKEHTNLKSTQRITLELKVLCALSFFATGSYQRIIGVAKNLGQTTVSKYVREVTEALISPRLMNHFIKFPETRLQRDIIRNKFYRAVGFPGVIGCIDGSQFHIFTPKKDREHLFYSRKHFHALNVQMVCDSDCRILNVNAKYGGATHDAFIWEFSKVNAFMQNLHRNNEQVWLLGDSGYPQRPWLMTPISNAAERSPEAKYTKIHGKARVCIENTFGRLKNRWRCLCKDRTLHYKPEKCAKIIHACSVLHNLAIDFRVPEPSPRIVEENIIGYGIRRPFRERYDSHDNLVRGRAIRSMIVDRINRLHA